MEIDTATIEIHRTGIQRYTKLIKLILAAGQGKRLKKTLPKGYPYITKALIPFNGEPALKRLLRQVNKNVQGETIIVLGHESEIIKKTIEIKI